jgi:hypothetical protein
MGSLQTEIQKTLNSWGTVQQPANTSIAGKVFDFVQNNPSCSSNDVVRATGIDLGRASATLLTLYQKGKLDRKPYPNPNPDGKRDTIYHYWTSVDNFTDKGEKRVAKKPKKDKALSKANVSIEDVNTARFDLPRIRHIPVEQAPTKKEFDPQSFVADLNVRDAKEVYLLLKGYFE